MTASAAVFSFSLYLYLCIQVQRAMERILYIWAIRHPASGYVQGINDLMTPLYVVFLSAHVGECLLRLTGGPARCPR